MHSRTWLVLFGLLVAGTAHADGTNRFALEMSGVRYGLVVLKTTATAQLVFSTQDVAPPLVALVGTFAQGKPVKKDVRLSSGAVVRKANDARLASVRLPALGSGGVADVELAFVAAPLATQPLLSASELPPLLATARITGFRLDVNGMKPIEAPKLDAITLAQKADGTTTAGEIAFEAAAGGAPPFAGWQKSNGGHPPTRTVRIQYVGAEGSAILELQLEHCRPTAVLPMGASGTTRITLACVSVIPT